MGVGGITPTELTAAGASGLNRALHVSGNVMVGTQPVGTPSLVASSAMIMLNQATSAPTTKDYPGLYHRSVLSTTASTLGLQDSTGGLGITAPNFITFQTGIGATQSNSIVINSAGDVSVIGRTNLNGRVGVGNIFNDTTTRNGIQSILDISGVTHMSSSTNTYGLDNPRIKVISNAISRTADIPNFTHSVNEIRGMNTTENSGFLRLTAQTSGNSCIDLIGVNEHPNGSKYNNSVRFATGGVERMIIDGNGNVGVGTNALVTGVRLDVAGGQARVTAASTTSTALTTTGRVGINQAAPTVDLDVAGAARISGTLNMNSNKITNVTTPTAASDAANKSYVDTSIPIGGIIMWSGVGVALPSNWKFCDGLTHGNITTPDLRGRFVLSSGQGSGLTNRTTGGTGGVETVALEETHMPLHKHDVSARTGNSNGQAIDGSHTHYVSGSTSQDGLHSHTTPKVITWSNSQNYAGYQRSNYDQATEVTTSQAGTHSHSLTGSASSLLNVELGHDPRHNHTITVGETAKGSGTAHENMPPFYVLAFIMRVS